MSVLRPCLIGSTIAALAVLCVFTPLFGWQEACGDAACSWLAVVLLGCFVQILEWRREQ